MKKYIPFCLLFVLFAAACKKSSNSTIATTPAYYLATVQRIQYNDTENYHIRYNAQNQVDTITQPHGLLGFRYSSGSYNIEQVESPDSFGFIVDLDANGNITRINAYDSVFATYDSKGHISTESEYLSGSSYDTYIYAWVNGDIDSASDPNYAHQSITYYYDLTHPWQPGDGFGIDDFLQYGRPIVKSTHLLTQARYSTGDVTTYKYKFDSRSRIVQLTEIFFGDSIVYKYTYTTN